MMFLESIKHNQVDHYSIDQRHSTKSPPLDDSNTPISNEALSNLAFLDLSIHEKQNLEAKYKALSGQEIIQAQEDSTASEKDYRQYLNAEPLIF